MAGKSSKTTRVSFRLPNEIHAILVRRAIKWNGGNIAEYVERWMTYVLTRKHVRTRPLITTLRERRRPMSTEEKDKKEPEVGQMIHPKCGGTNIEPRGKMWWCNDCKEYFKDAITKQPEP
jgi:hypothetical protein